MDKTKLRNILKKLLQQKPHLSAPSIKELFDRSSISASERPTLVEIQDAITQEERLRSAKDPNFTGGNSPDPKDQKDHSCPAREISVISSGKCPYCHTIHPIKKRSTASRPRKICPSCGKKSEWKLWIQKDPNFTGGNSPDPKDQKDHSCPAREISVIPSSIHLTHREQQVFEGLCAGYFACNIAKQLNISPSTICRIIEKLKHMQVIEQVNTYPKTYKARSPQPSSTAPIGQWPTTTTIHCIRFTVPMKKRGDISRSYGVEKLNWDKRLFFGIDFPEIADWKVEVNTRCVIFDYTPKIYNTSTPVEDLEKLKRQIPVQFLLDRGFILDLTDIHSTQPEHAVAQFNDPEIDTLGLHGPLSVQDSDGGDAYHVDNSDKTGTPGVETTAKKMERVIDVPAQIQRLQQQLDQLTQTLTTYTQQFTQLLQTIIPKPQIPTTTPVADIYQ